MKIYLLKYLIIYAKNLNKFLSEIRRIHLNLEIKIKKFLKN